MTREEAIWAMQFYKEKLYNGIFNQYIEAFDMAIAALRERDILFEQVRGYCHTCKKNKTDFDCHAKCYGHQRGSAWEWDGGRRQEEA